MNEKKRPITRATAFVVSFSMICSTVPSYVQTAFAEDNINISEQAADSFNDKEKERMVFSETEGETMGTLKYTVSAEIVKDTTVRKGPAESYESAGKVKAGTETEITGFSGTDGDRWFEIRYGNGKGFVKAECTDVTDTTYREDRKGVTTGNVPVYNMSNAGNPDVIERSFYIPGGEEFRIIEKVKTNKGDVYKIEYKEKTGYIEPENVKLNPLLYKIEFNAKVHVELSDSLSVYDGTKTGYRKIGTAGKGTELIFSELIVRGADTWYKTTYKGRNAYCKSRYVNIADAEFDGRKGMAEKTVSAYNIDDRKLKTVFRIPEGEFFEFYEKIVTDKGSRYKVKYKGRTGYIKTDGVSLNPIIERADFPVAVYKTTKDVLTVYKNTQIYGEKVADIPKGTKVTITELVRRSKEDWYKTTYKGKTVFCKARSISLISEKYDSREGVAEKNVKAYTVSDRKVNGSFTVSEGSRFLHNGKVMTEAGDVYRIVSNGKTGYVEDRYIDTDPELETVSFPKSVHVIVKKNTPLRKSSAENSKIMATAPEGTELVLTGKSERYSGSSFKTSYKGESLYCSDEDISILSEEYKNRVGRTYDKKDVYDNNGSAIVRKFSIEKEKYFDILGEVLLDGGDKAYKIRYNNKTGFITGEDVTLNPLLESFEYPDPVKVTASEKINVYDGTKSQSKVREILPEGTKITLTKKSYRSAETWYTAEYNNETGYIKTRDIDIRNHTYRTPETDTLIKTMKIYKEVSDRSEVLKSAGKGTTVKIYGTIKTAGATYAEVYAAGVKGYVPENILKSSVDSDIVNSYSYTMDVYGRAKSETSLRVSPSKSAEIVVRIPEGKQITAVGRVNKTEDSWYKVKYDGRILYASTKEMRISDKIYSTIVGAYTTSSLNLRASIGTDVAVREVIPEKGILRVLAKFRTSKSNWYKVEFNGEEGYVNGSYIKFGDMGIDISKYNTSIDWDKVKSSGIDFVFIRAGYTGYGNGLNVEDPYFQKHIKGAISAGLDIGVYYFTQAVTTREAREEVDFVNQVIKPYKKHINLPVVIDTEYISSSRPGRADHLSKSQRTAVVKAFCERVEYRGYDPMIYMSKSWITGNLNYNDIKQFPIWVAQYNTHNTTPQPYRYWQYTSDGSVPGIKGRVDMNIKM